MRNQLYWQLFLRVASEEKANRLLTRIAESTSLAIPKAHPERYWKDPSLFRVQLVWPLTAATTAEAVLETLQVCSHLADRWTIGPPQFYESGAWEFSGSADSATIKIPGLAYADFQAGNIRIGNGKTAPVEEEISH